MRRLFEFFADQWQTLCLFLLAAILFTGLGLWLDSPKIVDAEISSGTITRFGGRFSKYIGGNRMVAMVRLADGTSWEMSLNGVNRSCRVRDRLRVRIAHNGYGVTRRFIIPGSCKPSLPNNG